MIASSLCNAGTKFSGEDGIDARKMNEHKRSPCSIDQNTFPSLPAKRQKPDLSVSTKERKENVGAKIVALQQLVSPNGKTDTASVLSVAMEYIQFLHEQVKVLSAPYLQSVAAAELQELEPYSLRSRGLCVVPVSCTHGVARSNGADIWAPMKNTCPKYENSVSQFH